MVTPVRLVSLQEASDHLRRDTTADNADLQGKIDAASARVLTYIDTGIARYQNSSGAFIAPYVDSSGNFLPPYEVKAATLLLVGYLYEQRDEDADKEFDDGELPRPVRSLLRNVRRMVLA